MSPLALTLLVGASSTLFAILVSFVGGRTANAKMEQRLDDKIAENAKTFEAIEAQIEKIWQKWDFHVRESQEIRQKFYEQIGEVKGEIAKRDGQFDTIMGQLKRIEDRLNNFNKN